MAHWLEGLNSSFGRSAIYRFPSLPSGSVTPRLRGVATRLRGSPAPDWFRHAGQRSGAARSRATRPHIINRGPPPVHAVNDLHAAVPRARWSEGVVNSISCPHRTFLVLTVAGCEGICAACTTAYWLQSPLQFSCRITSWKLISILWHWLHLACS
jgi:hypothetical protein